MAHTLAHSAGRQETRIPLTADYADETDLRTASGSGRKGASLWRNLSGEFGTSAISAVSGTNTLQVGNHTSYRASSVFRNGHLYLSFGSRTVYLVSIYPAIFSMTLRRRGQFLALGGFFGAFLLIWISWTYDWSIAPYHSLWYCLDGCRFCS